MSESWYDYMIRMLGRGSEPAPAPVPTPTPPTPAPAATPAPTPAPEPTPAPIPPTPPTPVPAPVPTPVPAATTKHVRINHLSLTGPLHPMFSDYPGPEWRFMDTANSSSIRVFSFTGDVPGPFYEWVQLVVNWYPRNTSQRVRLVYAYTNAVPAAKDWPEVARIEGAPRSPGPGYPAGWSVRPDATDAANAAATDFFRRMVAEKRDFYVGWQICGDGSLAEYCEFRLTSKEVS